VGWYVHGFYSAGMYVTRRYTELTYYIHCQRRALPRLLPPSLSSKAEGRARYLCRAVS
jgi:hypothetical protein